MKKPRQPTVLATFRVVDNVLTHITDTTYRINGKLTQNSDLEAISTHSINLLTRYLDENYIDHNIVIRLDTTVSTEDCNDVPLNILILAESSSDDEISEDIKSALCSVVVKFTEDVLSNHSDLFATSSPNKTGIFTSEQSDLIAEYSSNFINKFSGKSIKKPFVYVIPGERNTTIPIQGTFKNLVNNNDLDEDDAIFFAHSDGFKGSGNLVFLKIVGAADNLVNGDAKTYIADRESYLKIAAAAYSSDNPLVKVVIRKEKDAQGKTSSYIKDISQANIEELGEFELELTV